MGNNSEPAASSDPASASAATAATATAAASSGTTADAARSSCWTSRRNPDCAADNHPHWGDPPDSYTAECSTVTGDQSPDDGGSRLITAHCYPNCPNSGSNSQPAQTGQTIQLQGGQQVY